MSRSYKKGIPYHRGEMSRKPARGKHRKKKKLIPCEWCFRNISQLERERKTTTKHFRQIIKEELT